jgi:hypothetical protein
MLYTVTMRFLTDTSRASHLRPELCQSGHAILTPLALTVLAAVAMGYADTRLLNVDQGATPIVTRRQNAVNMERLDNKLVR